MRQALFFLLNGIANSGTIAPVSRCHVAAIGTCLPGQSRASDGGKLACEMLSKLPLFTWYERRLSRFLCFRYVPCHKWRYAILRDPSRFACFLSNALCFCPVMCLFFRHTPIRRIFVLTPIGGIFVLPPRRRIFSITPVWWDFCQIVQPGCNSRFAFKYAALASSADENDPR